MLDSKTILKKVKEKGEIRTKDLVDEFKLTRQYVSRILSKLVHEHKLLMIGNAPKSFYVLPESEDKYQEEMSRLRYSKILKNENLEEHIILDDIEKNFFRSILRCFKSIPFDKIFKSINF